MAQAGKNAGEIGRALLAGDFPGLDALPADQLPPRTRIQYHARRARRDLEPVPDVEAFAHQLEQAIVRMARDDMRRIEKKRQDRTWADARLLAQHRKTIAEIRDRGIPVEKSDQQRGGEERAAQRRAEPVTVLGQLGEAVAKRDSESEPVADDLQEDGRVEG